MNLRIYFYQPVVTFLIRAAFSFRLASNDNLILGIT